MKKKNNKNKKTVDYLIALSNYVCPDQLRIYTGFSVFANFSWCLGIAAAVQQKYKPWSDWLGCRLIRVCDVCICDKIIICSCHHVDMSLAFRLYSILHWLVQQFDSQEMGFTVSQIKAVDTAHIWREVKTQTSCDSYCLAISNMS